MGITCTEITLKNYIDEVFVQHGHKKQEDIRTATVEAVVDTGSMYMAITDELCQKLGLITTGEKTVLIANGQRVSCKKIEVLKVQWKNRDTVVPAIVIPGSEKILFGAMALEGMDLMVDPVNQEVVGAHGDKIEILAL